jgi:hypothetical protein
VFRRMMPAFTRAPGPGRSEAVSWPDGSTRPRHPRWTQGGAEGICETSPVDVLDTIDGARRAFEIAGRGCLVRLGEDEPRYATVSEITARLEPHPDATMLLTAVSEAVERYDPSREAAILLEVASGYQVLILSSEGYDYVGGLTFEGYGLLGASRL